MKKKPHLRKSVIEKVFSDFRKRIYNLEDRNSDVHYEVKKNKKGFTVIAHKERGVNETFHFEDKKALDAFLKMVK